MTEDIRCETHGAVRLITIDRPEKMNSLDFTANARLVKAWKDFDADPALRVAVITGAGDQAFCAGADLKTYTLPFARAAAPDFRERYTNGPGFGGITRNLHMAKPVIAAVNGYAISGGFELSLACDLRFCSPNAEFALQDVKWGFHACDGGLIRLPQIVGLGHAMEIVLSGERVGSQDAYRMGLVNRVWPAEDLLPRTLDFAQRIASRAPLPQRFAKEIMRRAVGMPMDEALWMESRSFHDIGMTSDLEEGLAAFRERRDARFEGR